MFTHLRRAISEETTHFLHRSSLSPLVGLGHKR